MAVRKINSRSMLFSRLLSESSDEIRRMAQKIVNHAQGEKKRSEQIVDEAADIVKRAERTVRDSQAKREQREKDRGDGSGRKR